MRLKIRHVICALRAVVGVVLSYFAVEDFAVGGVSIDDRPPGLLTLLS